MRKPAFALFSQDKRKPFDVVCDLYKMKNFIGYYAYQRIVIGREKSRHCQTWFERRFSWNEWMNFKTTEGKTL